MPPRLSMVPSSRRAPSSSLSSPPAHRELHSFPTRRSSDLGVVIDRLLRLTHRHGRRDENAVPENDGCRSEEHTSELQSLTNLVCRLLLEKKKNVQAGPELPAVPGRPPTPHREPAPPAAAGS